MYACGDCPIQSDFKTLQINTKSSKEDIRKAYKSLALQYHPDKNDGSDSKFKDINSAYVNIIRVIEGDLGALCESCRSKQADIPDNSCDAYVISFKECSQCIVVHLNEDHIDKWTNSCKELYGTPKDLGMHGLKFSCGIVLMDETGSHDVDDTQQSSTIKDKVHVTVYMNGTVLIQGNAYIWWYLEHLPYILNHSARLADFPAHVKGSVIECKDPSSKSSSSTQKPSGSTRTSRRVQSSKGCSITSDSSKDLKATTEGESVKVSCIRCYLPDNKKMVQCSQCDSWTHYSCTDLNPDDLKYVCKSLNRIYECRFCLDALAFSQSATNSGSSDTAPVGTSHLPVDVVETVHCEKLVNNTTSSQENVPSSSDNIHAECSSRFNKLIDRIDNIERQMMKNVQSQSVVNDSATSLETLKKENSGLRKEISQLDSRNHKLESEISALRKELAFKDKQSQLNLALDSELKLVKEKLACTELLFEERDLRLRGELSNCQSSLKSLNAQIRKTEDELYDRNKLVSDLQSELEMSKPSVASKSVGPDVQDDPCADLDSDQMFTPVVHKKWKPRKAGIKTPRENTVQSPVSGKRAGGHLVVTSSLGKGLHWRGLRPTPNDTVKIRAMSGATVQQVKNYIAKSSELYKNDSISILVGTNDINKGASPSSVEAEYGDMMATISDLQPQAKVFVQKLPPRLGQGEHNKNVEELNHRLKSVCDSFKNATFVDNGITSDSDLFVKGGVHLSTDGSKLLAKSIKNSISTEVPAASRPPSSRKLRPKNINVMNQSSTVKKLLLSIVDNL